MNELTELVNILHNDIINELLQFTNYIKSRLPYITNINERNSHLTKLVQTQRIINKTYSLIKDILNLSNDNLRKSDLPLYNVLCLEQNLLKDYISTMQTLLSKWNIPKTEYEQYTNQLITTLYEKLKNQNYEKLTITKINYKKN